MTTEKSDNEVNEAFAKAIGLEKCFAQVATKTGKKVQVHTGWTIDHKLIISSPTLPNWCQDWPASKRDVIERMEADGYEPRIIKKKIGGLYFAWQPIWAKTGPVDALIKDNEILRAGVESATEYLERRKG